MATISSVCFYSNNREKNERSGETCVEFEVSTESGSDRVTVSAISIIAIGFYPVATALGRYCITVGKSWKEKTGSAEKSTRPRNASFRSEPVSIILKDLGDEDVEAAKVC